jgi:hypothetical protein
VAGLHLVDGGRATVGALVAVELRDRGAVGLDRGRRAVQRAQNQLPLIERVEQLNAGRDALARASLRFAPLRIYRIDERCRYTDLGVAPMLTWE